VKVTTISGDVQEIVTDLLVLPRFEDEPQLAGDIEAVDRALAGGVSDLMASGDFHGKAGELAVLYSRGVVPARRLLMLGLGKRSDYTHEALRRAAGAVARRARDLGATHYHIAADSALWAGMEPAAAGQALAEGTLLGAYRFLALRTDLADEKPDLETCTLLAPEGDGFAALSQGVADGVIIAESVCQARDLVNQPGNYCTPTLLARTAQQIAAETGLRCEVLGHEQMAALGMTALLAVAQGSAEPPQFIVLEHNTGRSDLPTYVVVGKGLTFDSGGISIKPADGMEAMKYDMAGAAATLGALRAVARLDLPLHVVGLVPATENLPGGRAYKPGDVIKSMAGLTIEVISTDAEGRIILADALSYARRFKPAGLVDLATLTGACVIALGHVACGLLGNNAELVAALKRAADQSGERAWEMPTYPEYAEQIKSDIADIKNVGGRPAGVITGGLFIGKFASEYPWAHLDIAGMMSAERTDGYMVKGGMGYGVRLLVQWLRNLSPQA
jgi:leucyl aminopeptidase